MPNQAAKNGTFQLRYIASLLKYARFASDRAPTSLLKGSVYLNGSFDLAAWGSELVKSGSPHTVSRNRENPPTDVQNQPSGAYVLRRESPAKLGATETLHSRDRSTTAIAYTSHNP
ncbi:hypothetical protein FRC03_005384, partial [Tulasnella sp. 419]